MFLGTPNSIVYGSRWMGWMEWTEWGYSLGLSDLGFEEEGGYKSLSLSFWV